MWRLLSESIVPRHRFHEHARFTVGDDTFEVGPGDVVKGPAAVPHAYENIGPGRLRTVDIHLSREWMQTDLV